MAQTSIAQSSIVQNGASGTRPDYIPALDGLRAVSILLVVGSHAGLDHVLPGGFGVTLFFFISGYLITRQLQQALQTTGRLRLPNFYLRRLLRLMPAAVVYILLAGSLFVLAGGRVAPAGWAAALFYGANYYDLWVGYKTSLPGVRHPFNILWSLAIEEHFYALWPAALAWLWRRRMTAAALLALCVAVLCWRAWLYDSCCHAGGPDRFNRLYLATDTRLDSIAYGALLATVERAGWRWRPAFYPALGLLLLSFLLPGSFVHEVLRTSLQGIALCCLVPALIEPGRIMARALSVAPALAVGRLSYSLYLWHWGAFALADGLAPRFGPQWQMIAWPTAAGLALCSYQGIERPLLALRRRAGSHVPLTPLMESPHAAT